jgi:hypothetical protein
VGEPAGSSCFTKWNQCAAAAAGQKTEVPDADEAARQHMQQKTTQELIDVQSQKSLLVLVNGVAPAERRLVIDEGNEPAIGNRNAMGVKGFFTPRDYRRRSRSPD